MQAVPEQVASYWRSVLDRVDKPNARRLLSDLDVSHPLGVQRDKKSSSPPMYEFYLETKNLHPYAVLLVRVSLAGLRSALRCCGPARPHVAGPRPTFSHSLHCTLNGARVQCGDFYEAVGTDAVLLVQFAGLNPMGSKRPPRAGCPKQNIRRVLNDMVNEAGLTVVRALHNEFPATYILHHKDFPTCMAACKCDI